MSDATFTRRINIYVDSGQAAQAYDVLAKKNEKLTAEVKKYTDAGKEIPVKLKKALDDTTAAMERQQKKISGELNPSLKDLTGTVGRLRNELKGMSEQDSGFGLKKAQYDAAKLSLDKYSSSLLTVRERFKEMLTTAKGVAFGVLVGNGIQGAVQSAISGIQNAFSVRNEFEGKVRNLSAITGASGEQLEYLKKKAIELSTTSSKSASDFVEAMKLIASAKAELLQDAEALAEVTKQADRLAKASGLDLPDAATRLTDALNQFGAGADEAAKYVDILAAAAKYGAAEVPDITSALLEFGPVAKQANINIYESAAAIEVLAEKGIKGSEAGTKLRNVFLALSASKALPKEATDVLKAAGINTDLLSDKSIKLGVKLKELSKIAGDTAAMVKVFDKQNVAAATNLLTNLDRYKQLEEQIHETGVASTQAAQNTANLASAWKRLTNVLTSYILQIPTEGLTSLIKSMTDLVRPTDSATDALSKQKDTFNSLTHSIFPLLQRHDELKSKTTLTAGEQEELKQIIDKVSAAVPMAVTEFDEYGKALDINTAKAKDFIRTQQLLLQLKYKDAIAEEEEALKKLNREYSNASFWLEYYTKNAGKLTETIYSPSALLKTHEQLMQQYPNLVRDEGAYLTMTRDVSKEIATWSEKVNEFAMKIQDAKLLLAGMKGEVPDAIVIGPKTKGQTTSFNPLLGPGEYAKLYGAGGQVNDPDEEARKKAKDLADLIKRLRQEIYLDQLEKNFAELEALRFKYEEEQKAAQGNKEALHLLDVRYHQQYVELLDKQVKESIDHFNKIAEGFKPSVLNTPGALSEINYVAPTQRGPGKDEVAGFKKFGDTFSKYSDNATSLLQQFYGLWNTLEENRVQNTAAQYDKEAKALERRLKRGEISQKQYDVFVSNLNDRRSAAEKKEAKKAFERQKALQIAMLTVQAITASLTAYASQLVPGDPTSIIRAGIAAGVTGSMYLLQIASAAAADAPSYGKGTILEGDPHSAPSKGNPTIDPKTGRIMYYTEAGEAVIAKNTVQANPGIIRALLGANGNRLNMQSVMGIASLAGGGLLTQYAGTAHMPAAIFEDLARRTGGGYAGTAHMPAAIFEDLARKLTDIHTTLKESEGRKIVFSKYDFDQFNQRSDFVFKRNSIEGNNGR